MAQKPLSDKELRRTATLLRKHGGDRSKVAAALGVMVPTIASRVRAIQDRLPDEALPEARRAGQRKMDASKMSEAMAALEAHGGHMTNAAKSLGLPRSTFEKRIYAAQISDDWRPQGKTKALTARKMALPKGKEIARYILTCAQSGTKLHEPTWNALRALADYYDARLVVSTFSYSHRQEGSAKRGTQGRDGGVDWYDPRIEPFVSDDMVALAPSLVFNGHMNILPTAVDPLSGMTNYNGRASSIFPHVKVAMTSIATLGAATKFQYTTGTATQMNYIAKKAGQKAEFDHVFGGLIVEVNSAGEWWVRQLHVDGRGRLYDLDVVAMPQDGEVVVVPALPPKAIVFGDVHVAQLEEGHRENVARLAQSLQPDLLVFHDILDFESRSHHNRRDPHKMFELHTRGRDDVRREVEGVGAFLKEMSAVARCLVVNSNHDRHLERWLKEADWRTDPVNAEIYVECQRAYLASVRAGERFDALKWAVQSYNAVKGVRFLAPGESYVVCRDRSGGVELGLHGDLGPGGSRGSLRNLSRIGRKVVIGHSHSAGIFNGAYQVGVSGRLDMEYARGAPSAWSHTDCVVYPSGKRTLVTWWKGKWRA